MTEYRKDVQIVAISVGVAIFAAIGLAVTAQPEQTAPATTVTTVVPDTTVPDTTTTLPATTTTVAPTTTLPPQPPVKSLCPQHYAAALAAGWTDTEWQTLDRIMFRESRCDPTAHNDSWLRGGRDNSYGLTQINLLYHDYWVLPQIGNDPTYLFDPVINLRIARQLWEWLETHHQCGWSAWRGTCD